MYLEALNHTSNIVKYSLFYCLEGNATYYDFKLNNTIYKIINTMFTQVGGTQHCRDLFGPDASLLDLTSAAQFEDIKIALMDRLYTSYNVQFWINGSVSDVGRYMPALDVTASPFLLNDPIHIRRQSKSLRVSGHQSVLPSKCFVAKRASGLYMKKFLSGCRKKH